MASGVIGDMTPAAGVLSCIAAHSEAARELVFAARPAVLPHLLNALSAGSPSLTASAIGAQALTTKHAQKTYVSLSGAAAVEVDPHACS